MRLLDVNVLLAGALEAHEHHEAVSRWMRDHPAMPLATCALTETSLLRLLMNPVINEEPIIAATGIALLERLHANPRHRFLRECPSPCEPAAAEILTGVHGYRQVTDAYLLTLAMANGGKLATLDRKLAGHLGTRFLEVVEAV